MKDVKVCGIQITVKPADVEANVRKGVSWIEKSVKMYRPDLVVFPETVTTGFATGLSARKLNGLVDRIPGRTTREIMAAARRHRVHVVWPTYEKGPSGRVYNSSVLIDDRGKVRGVYRKTHPFPTERSWTVPGKRAQVYNTSIGRIGMIICFDGDFPELARLMGLNGVDIVVRPSAFLRSFDTWLLTNTARAYDSRAYLVAVNAVGQDGGGSYYYGHSMILSPLGNRIAQGLCREEIIHAVLKKDPLRYVSYGSSTRMLTDNLKLRNTSAYRGLEGRRR